MEVSNLDIQGLPEAKQSPWNVNSVQVQNQQRSLLFVGLCDSTGQVHAKQLVKSAPTTSTKPTSDKEHRAIITLSVTIASSRDKKTSRGGRPDFELLRVNCQGSILPEGVRDPHGSSLPPWALPGR